jgi:sulfur carrier protein ThiS
MAASASWIPTKLMPDDEQFLARIDHKINQTIDAFFSGEAEHTLSLDELQLRIRLSGPTWAGVVDKPVAKFLVDLDAMLTDELRSLGIIIPESTHGLVALQIQDGSWEAVLKYSKELFRGFSKMSPRAQLLILATVLAALGISSSDKIIAAINAPSLAKISASQEQVRAKERVELVEAVGRIREREHQLQTPVRSLVNKMDAADRIDLPGKPKSLKKEEAKNALVSNTRGQATQYYVDHPYKVESLNTRDPDHWKIGLSFGDVSFSAEVMLNKDEMESLLKDFQEAHSQNRPIALPMHVTAKASEKGITSAKVMGLGDPRKGAVRLSEALRDAKTGSTLPTTP